MSAHLDESTRLTIRNTLLANPDLDLDATMSTAISHLLSPLLAAYVASARAEAWDEGYAAAGLDFMAGYDAHIENKLRPTTTANPYRTVGKRQ